jgi:hypothetical protein
MSEEPVSKKVKVDIVNGRRYLNGVHAFTYKRPPALECDYYCFLSTEDQGVLDRFIDCMEQLQFVINNFTEKKGLPKELQVVINFDDKKLKIKDNTLGNCFKFLHVSNWNTMPLGNSDNMVFYRFNDSFEIEQSINRHFQDDIVVKSVPKIKKMYFDSDSYSKLPLLDCSFQGLSIH